MNAPGNSTAIRRHLLGWDAPVTDRVRSFLVPEGHAGPLRLDETLVIVPTRQAGRRLREHLARWCTEHDIPLLSLQVNTPNFFLLGTRPPGDLASPTDILHAWARVFREIDLGQYTALFPAGVVDPDMPWAISMGSRLQKLRDQLLEGGLTISQAARLLDDQADEKARWLDLMKLEQAYLALLRAEKRVDPCAHKIDLNARDILPEGVTRVVLACIPDPTPLMIRQLEKLVESKAGPLTLEVLVHADPARADDFDAWGRPLTEAWKQVNIPFTSEAQLILAADPLAQSRRVLQLITQHAPEISPGDVAIGVPDSDVIPQLSATLEAHDLPVFNPAGYPVTQHSLYHFLDAWQALLADPGYAAFRGLTRHPAILHYLQAHDIAPVPLLKCADEHQNRYLPQAWSDLAKGGEAFALLHRALDHLTRLLETYRESPGTEEALRHLLVEVFQHRVLGHEDPADRDFREVAQVLDQLLTEFRDSLATGPGWKPEEALHLLLERFGTETWYAEHEDTVVDLDGWLELSWNDAPLMIVTGMNDQSVPDGRVSDLFLPDSLRERLKLRTADDRFARDIYLCSSFIHSRAQTQGQVYFICGKVNSRGEPLRPSRLLLRCADEDLIPRVRKLFGQAREDPDNVPVSTAFKLDPSRIAKPIESTQMHVTTFADYLACPFRFYLKHTLEMHALADDFTELPNYRFGTILHDALDHMARHPDHACSTQADQVADYMIAYMNRRFAEVGHDLTLPVQIQRDAGQQRLRAAADEHARLIQDGWRIVASECRFERVLEGLTITGKIDRIDYHEEHGIYRVLDYKTADRVQDAEKLHFATRVEAPAYARVDGGKKAWTSLQLPLYRFLVEESYPDSTLHFGIFNLPKSLMETGVKEWTGFSDDIYASAMDCAAGVIQDIRDGRFWPPGDRVRFDDFTELFFEQPEDFALPLQVPRAGGPEHA